MEKDKMNDLEKLSEQLQGDITECIKGLVGFLTYPHRERLKNSLHQAVIDRINENTVKEENKIPDSKIPSSGNDTISTEGRIHPDVQAWVTMNKDTIEWMTEVTNNNMTPRSDCG